MAGNEELKKVVGKVKMENQRKLKSGRTHTGNLTSAHSKWKPADTCLV